MKKRERVKGVRGGEKGEGKKVNHAAVNNTVFKRAKRGKEG